MLADDRSPTLAELVSAPKVLLHDHLDGGLRPATIIELAHDQDYRELPSDDPAELTRWFANARHSGSLETYLSGFVHAYGVLQTRDSLARAARENVEDLAADGIVYAETRFAPELHGKLGLDPALAIDAVVAGTREGMQQATADGHEIDVRVIVSAMRDRPNVAAVAQLLRKRKDPRVVAFDLGGPEAGHPASQFQDIFAELCANGIPLTLHAGEGDGVESVRQAVECGPQRLGHGVRIIDDIDGNALGPVAKLVHQLGLVLELCPSSNIHTGAVPSFVDHPAQRLSQLGFATTINTDNRVFSQTTLSHEFAELATHQEFTWNDVARMTHTAAKSAFLPNEERQELAKRVAHWHALELA